MRPQHRKFAAEYINNGGNGVQAVYAAGYVQGYNAACVTSSRLLRSAKVKSMIDNITDKAVIAAELTEERVKKEIASIAFSHVETIDSSAKMKGLDLATKVLGMQSSKLETVDLTQQSATESALLKSIQTAAKRDDIQPESAAIQLFTELSDDPALCDLSTWPAEYRPAIQSYLQQNEQVTEIGDQ